MLNLVLQAQRMHSGARYHMYTAPRPRKSSDSGKADVKVLLGWFLEVPHFSQTWLTASSKRAACCMSPSHRRSIFHRNTLSFCNAEKMLPSVKFFHPILNTDCQSSALTGKSECVRSLFWKICQAFKHCEVIYI